MESPRETNRLGNTAMGLGIASLALVFGIGLCAVVGAQQGWVGLLGTPLYVCGASSAFLGLIAAGLGGFGLVGGKRSRATAIAGLILGLLGMCLFIFVVQAVAGG